MDLDVIVVGGGPVGLMSAALLDAAGVRVEVYERNPGPSTESKATTMHPRTLEVLSLLELGDGRRVSDDLVDQGRKVPHAHFAALPTQLDYTHLDTPFPYVLMIPQWRTEHALAEYLRIRDVPVHYGAEVTAVTQSADAVQVTVGGTTLEASYVIGADGAHSSVRHAAGIDFPGNPPTIVNFVADVTLAAPVENATYYWDPNAGLAAIVPMPGDVYRIFGVEADEAGLSGEQVRALQAKPLTLESLRTSLERICGNDLGVQEALWLSRASNSSRYAQRYRDGRLLLVGDAAHVHLPAGGQGLNVGLQDATNLAWKLAAEVHGWAPDRLIAGPVAYETERREIAARLLDDTLAQDALMHTFSPSGQALRSMFAGFIDQGGEVAEELSGWLSGLAVHYPRPDGAHALAGVKAPDAVLPGEGLVRALRPDRFLLLDFSPNGAFKQLSSALVEVRAVQANATPWSTLGAVLIRPDGHVADATEASDPASVAELTEAIAAWTVPTSHTAVG